MFRHFVVLAAVPTVVAGQSIVNIEGRQVEYMTAGSGVPTVVFEAGQGDAMDVWSAVLDETAQLTSVLSYSRSGYGRSDYSGRADGRETSGELKALIEHLGVPKPIVLVGHSLGGWYVRTYAARYPSDVVGLVLVDGTAENVYREWAGRWPEFWASYDRLMADWVAAEDPPQAFQDEEAYFLRVVRAANSLDRIPLPPLPTAVITATRLDESWLGGTREGVSMWLAHHQQWVASVPRAVHVVSDRAGHYIQNDAPHLVLDGIRWVLRESRRQ